MLHAALLRAGDGASAAEAAPGAVHLAIGACFAAYHWAPGPAVLILPGAGYEATSTARVWRDLSLRLAERGVASLRPDLPGTGDSAGASDDPGHVAAWRASVRDCAGWLAARHGGPVSVLGCRFGALLAVDAVAGGLAAERLVLLDPPPSGKAYAREVRLRAGMGGGQGAAHAGGDASLDASGLVLGEAALSAIAAMPRHLPPGFRPPDTIVFSQGAREPGRGWPAWFREAGARVAVEEFTGYENFLLRSLVDMEAPTAVLDRVLDLFEPRPAAPPPPPAPPPSGLALPGCREEPRWFGAAPRRFGILCRPDRPRPGAPVVVLPSVAKLPRSGSDRTWTDLARLLAGDGFASFRFDQGGVGESDGAAGEDVIGDAHRPEHIDGVLAAVEAVDGWGLGRSVVVGLCSGAYTAWHAAARDARIAGVLVANTQHLRRVSTFERAALVSWTARQHLAGALDQLRSAPEGLRGAAALRLRRLRRGELRVAQYLRDFAAIGRRDAVGLGRRVAARLGAVDRESREVRRYLAGLVARGCAVHFVYSDRDGGIDAFHRVFGRSRTAPPGACLSIIEGGDHTFTGRRHRQRFFEAATGFVRDMAD